MRKSKIILAQLFTFFPILFLSSFSGSTIKLFVAHILHIPMAYICKKRNFEERFLDAVSFTNKHKFLVQCCTIKLHFMWDFSNSWIFRISWSYFKIQIWFLKMSLSSFWNINFFQGWWFLDDSHLKQPYLYMADSFSLVKVLPGFIINSTSSQI